MLVWLISRCMQLIIFCSSTTEQRSPGEKNASGKLFVTFCVFKKVSCGDTRLWYERDPHHLSTQQNCWFFWFSKISKSNFSKKSKFIHFPLRLRRPHIRLPAAFIFRVFAYVGVYPFLLSFLHFFLFCCLFFFFYIFFLHFFFIFSFFSSFFSNFFIFSSFFHIFYLFFCFSLLFFIFFSSICRNSYIYM